MTGAEGFIGAMVGNLMGDYLFQNDWMALNKKKSTFHCLVHCTIWTACVLLCSGWFHWLPALVLFAEHFLQDRTTIINWYMRKIGQHQFATGICAPWSVIFVDNVWHIVTLWGVSRWLAHFPEWIP